MAEIIIIRGTERSGKTTTSGLVYQELLNFCDKHHKFNNLDVNVGSLKYNTKSGGTQDFTAVLSLGNKSIGIISAGDLAINLKINLDYQLKNNVDIIICCARSKDVARSCYRMIIDEFSKTNNIVLEVFTKYSQNKEDKYLIKKDTVDKIVSKIRELAV